MFQEIERWAPWMSATEADALVDEINLMPTWQRKPKAKTLGERLNVPYGERARLKLRTIGCNDMTEAAMALMRKQKKRQRERLRRLAEGAKTRAEYLATSLSQAKPWVKQGISRRTWERRRVASPCPVKLTKTELTLASKEKTDTSAGLCGRVSTPTPAGQTDTYVNEFESLLGPWIPMNEMDWLGWTPELAAEVAMGAGLG
jgi:hypothetical protein